ncbi:hypothetical protein [Rickettsiales endosymbiont of Stachyamoeba lipophora]|uniref:hypothetical protein n=1 Tax=Rickettsiales endosymbiont of Stachyamoeba lipophora TaxID=2486578 RepID=UPI000F651C01|nr:hypothetical protein [Rickettsiales endosymbiont of Stachyamoeba lipophora]AZL15055.1 hypothetical protein EF513_00540 [Rickettsiales endosymbiont of Stachyamoeba lipophora]
MANDDNNLNNNDKATIIPINKEYTLEALMDELEEAIDELNQAPNDSNIEKKVTDLLKNVENEVDLAEKSPWLYLVLKKLGIGKKSKAEGKQQSGSMLDGLLDILVNGLVNLAFKSLELAGLKNFGKGFKITQLELLQQRLEKVIDKLKDKDGILQKRISEKLKGLKKEVENKLVKEFTNKDLNISKEKQIKREQGQTQEPETTKAQQKPQQMAEGSQQSNSDRLKAAATIPLKDIPAPPRPTVTSPIPRAPEVPIKPITSNNPGSTKPMQAGSPVGALGPKPSATTKPGIIGQYPERPITPAPKTTPESSNTSKAAEPASKKAEANRDKNTPSAQDNHNKEARVPSSSVNPKLDAEDLDIFSSSQEIASEIEKNDHAATAIGKPLQKGLGQDRGALKRVPSAEPVKEDVTKSANNANVKIENSNGVSSMKSMENPSAIKPSNTSKGNSPQKEPGVLNGVSSMKLVENHEAIKPTITPNVKNNADKGIDR